MLKNAFQKQVRAVEIKIMELLVGKWYLNHETVVDYFGK